MWAEQAPYIYDGPNCDQHRPDWRTNEAGSGETDSGGEDLVQLKADCFPAGTKIVISVPLCPECGESSDLGHFAKDKKLKIYIIYIIYSCMLAKRMTILKHQKKFMTL